MAAAVRRRRELWRLALNLSLTAAVGGALLLLVGATVAAWIMFGFGAISAAAAGLLLRSSDDRPRQSR